MLIDYTYKPIKKATYSGVPSTTTKKVTTKLTHLYHVLCNYMTKPIVCMSPTEHSTIQRHKISHWSSEFHFLKLVQIKKKIKYLRLMAEQSTIHDPDR
jgi:hypothetical protein